MFNITVVGLNELVARFDGMPSAVREEMDRTIQKLAKNLQAHIVRDKLHGQVLHQRSGRLARSIQQESPIHEGLATYGRVFSSGDVKYAKVHEYGGTFEMKGRAITRASHLAKRKDGSMAMTGTPYKATFPERSFMRTGLADFAPEIVTELKAAVIRGMKRASR